MNAEENFSRLTSRPVRRDPGSFSKLYKYAAGRAVAFQDLSLLAARLLLARTFILSGLTKWDGFSIREDTFYLFTHEYFGKYNLPSSITNVLAIASSVGEIILPVLLILGLMSRVAALGLLSMTMVIQILIYPDAWWTAHAWWVALAGIVFAFGPGRLSLDRRFGLE